MPEISIIVPVYNSEKYLTECIESVLSQSYSNWELVLVDDGSKDTSGKICDKYSKKDKRIKCIHKENGGVSSARNIGIEVAIGNRIMFLDSDDQLSKNSLKELSTIYNEYDYDVICFALKTSKNKIYPMCEKKTVAKNKSTQAIKDIRMRAFTGYSLNGKKDHCMHFVVTKLIKKKIIDDNKLKFNTKLKYHEDTLFCIQLLEVAESIITINEYYYIRNEHNESASVSYNKNIYECNSKCIELFEEFIEKNYKNVNEYRVAMEKYKMAWIMQCLKLDFINKKSNDCFLERYKKVKKMINNQNFSIKITPFSSDLKPKQKIFAILLKLKLSIPLMILAKINMN